MKAKVQKVFISANLFHIILYVVINNLVCGLLITLFGSLDFFAYLCSLFRLKKYKVGRSIPPEAF